MLYKTSRLITDIINEAKPTNVLSNVDNKNFRENNPPT